MGPIGRIGPISRIRLIRPIAGQATSLRSVTAAGPDSYHATPPTALLSAGINSLANRSMLCNQLCLSSQS